VDGDDAGGAAGEEILCPGTAGRQLEHVGETDRQVVGVGDLVHPVHDRDRDVAEHAVEHHLDARRAGGQVRPAVPVLAEHGLHPAAGLRRDAGPSIEHFGHGGGGDAREPGDRRPGQLAATALALLGGRGPRHLVAVARRVRLEVAAGVAGAVRVDRAHQAGPHGFGVPRRRRAGRHRLHQIAPPSGERIDAGVDPNPQRSAGKPFDLAARAAVSLGGLRHGATVPRDSSM
jgi:hypothetical protein